MKQIEIWGIIGLLVASIVVCGCTVVSDVSSIIDGNHTQVAVERSYNYILEGREYTIKTTMYSDLNEHLARSTHTYTTNSDDEILRPLYKDREQDKVMDLFISNMESSVGGDKDKAARAMIALVQNIPYSLKGDNTDWYYPYETLYLNRGQCSDKAILLSYILNRMGYESVYIKMPSKNHAAVGISSSAYISKYLGYVYVETTNAYPVSYLPHDIGNVDVSRDKIVIVGDGKKQLSIEQKEISDALQLQRMGGYVTDAISSKYGMCVNGVRVKPVPVPTQYVLTPAKFGGINNDPYSSPEYHIYDGVLYGDDNQYNSIKDKMRESLKK
jgi:hypothetical protein